MALIVSDGTGLIDADSFISLDDAREYALKYGYKLPIDDTDAEVALRKGVIYVELYEGSFSGERLKDTQSLSWPRKHAYKMAGQDVIYIEPDAIPNEVKYSQVIAAHYYNAGVNARVNDDGLAVASKEVVGAVKVSYFDNGKTGKSTKITEAVDMLSNLLVAGSAFTMKTLRV
jgi:hypothetical protein